MTISNAQITDAGINYQRQRTVMDYISERYQCSAFISVFISVLAVPVQVPLLPSQGLSVAATLPLTSAYSCLCDSLP